MRPSLTLSPAARDRALARLSAARGLREWTVSYVAPGAPDVTLSWTVEADDQNSALAEFLRDPPPEGWSDILGIRERAARRVA